MSNYDRASDKDNVKCQIQTFFFKDDVFKIYHPVQHFRVEVIIYSKQSTLQFPSALLSVIPFSSTLLFL